MTRRIATGVLVWLLISGLWLIAAYLLITKEESC